MTEKYLSQIGQFDFYQQKPGSPPNNFAGFISSFGYDTTWALLLKGLVTPIILKRVG